MIYLIGGVARAGKTSIMKRLLSDYKIPGLETDSLRTMFELSLPELKIHYQNLSEDNALRMEPFIKAFIESRFFFDYDFVLEGDCITPEVARVYGNNRLVKSLFLGYPNILLEKKIKQLVENPEGWTKGLSDYDLKEKIELFIKQSRLLRESCDKANLSFIDTSDLDIEGVVSAALINFNLK